MIATERRGAQRRLVRIPVGRSFLSGILEWPPHASGLVVIAADRMNGPPRWRIDTIAERLLTDGLATLILGLGTGDEIRQRARLDARGLLRALDWVSQQAETRYLPVGILGSNAGAVTAVRAAAMAPEIIRALVCLDGRLDVAADVLSGVKAQTLLLVDTRDRRLVEMNRRALAQIRAPSRLLEIPAMSHLGHTSLECASRWTSEWFVRALALEPAWHHPACDLRPLKVLEARDHLAG